MKILFVVPSYKPAFIYGGTIVAIARLAEILVLQGHEVTVYTTTANGKEELDVPVGKPVLVDGVIVYYFSRITKDHTHLSFQLYKKLYQTAKDFDAVHIHSWWNLLVVGAAAICAVKKVDYIISPHGMLSKYIQETNNSFQKRLLHTVIGRWTLAKSYLHVSTELELEESRLVIPDWAGSIIPNPVSLPKKKYDKPVNDFFTIGFLSRVDPKKGLDVLIRALSNVSFKYRLLIAGSGEELYVKQIKHMILESNMDQYVEWVGWKNEQTKFEFLSQLDLFALTSHSENFAIVVIESLSVGTPVLVSNNVGLCKYVESNDLGWVTSIDRHDVVNALEQSFLETEKRNKISEFAKSKILTDYNDAYIADLYIQMYRSRMT